MMQRVDQEGHQSRCVCFCPGPSVCCRGGGYRRQRGGGVFTVPGSSRQLVQATRPLGSFSWRQQQQEDVRGLPAAAASQTLCTWVSRCTAREPCLCVWVREDVLEASRGVVALSWEQRRRRHIVKGAVWSSSWLSVSVLGATQPECVHVQHTVLCCWQHGVSGKVAPPPSQGRTDCCFGTSTTRDRQPFVLSLFCMVHCFPLSFLRP